MRLDPVRRFLLPLACALLLACGSSAPSALPPSASASLVETSARGTVYLVRHGETEGEGNDPALSDEGRARAARLAELLASRSIERILTTDYRRTRETATPLAELLGVDVELYDPHELQEAAATLRREGGKVVVIGHSNTTPSLVALLGGDPGPPIAESEHDRLYHVELPSGETTMERYQ